MQFYLIPALALAASGAFASPSASRLQTRNIVDEATSDTYDFVIVGGGLAGLVLGGRLSEEKDYTVLVLEAGGDGGDYIDQINTPGDAYWGDLWNDELNWNFPIAAQPGLNNRTMHQPRGKVLGGSSAINGMYLTRFGKVEQNAWQDILGGMDGAENWGWDAMYAAAKKSETFTAPSAAIAKEGGITWDASSRGTSGPLQATYPQWTTGLLGDWAASAVAAGLPKTDNAYGGLNQGAYIATSAINPANYTRSYSRSAYLDPLPPRDNYDVVTNALVSKILFDTSSTPLTATAVEYIDNGGATKKVNVKKEVILSAGSFGSPVVLQRSGIGPKDVLSAAGVDMILESSGVGAQLQDHPSVQMNWLTNDELAGDVWDSDPNGPIASYANDAVAFVGSEILMGGAADGLKSSVLSSIDKYAPADPKVAAGYKAVVETTAKTIFPSTQGQVEILMAVTNDNGSVNIQITLQHEYSRGTVNIVSNDPTVYPEINPNYLAHPADLQIFEAGIKYARKICSSGPLGQTLKEDFPGAGANLESFVRSNLYTEFHPCATCSMLPEAQGGVVNANLMVYGTSNVRVADASVLPFEPSSHLMGTCYALAEQASDIIKDYWKNGGKTLDSDTTTSRTTPKGSKSGGGSGNSASSSGVSLLHIVSAFFAVAACIMFGY